MTRLLLIGLVPALLTGCGTSAPKETDTHLRYTVRDMSGTRSSRNRESVLKTVGMAPDQIRAWAREGPGDENRMAVTEDAPGGPGQVMITVRNERGRVSSRDGESASKALQMNDDQIREWVKEDQGGREGRSASLYKGGYVEIIWRGSAGQLLYTLRNERGSRTGRDRDSVMKTLAMSDDQVKAWAEDEPAASEGRCATFFRSEYVEGISRGVLEDPPWEG